MKALLGYKLSYVFYEIKGKKIKTEISCYKSWPYIGKLIPPPPPPFGKYLALT